MSFLIISSIKNILILCLLRISHCHIILIDFVYSFSRFNHHSSNYFKLFLEVMIWYSSMTTATQLQQSCNNDISISQDTISENKRCIMKSESEEAEDELSLDINEQLTRAMLQRNELQKKQKLAAIWSKIETLQVIETTKKNHSAFIWAFTQALMKNLNDLCIVSIVSTTMKRTYHEIILQKQRLSMFLKKYHDKIIKSEFVTLKSHFKILLDILKVMRKRFCTAWFISRMNQRSFDSIMKRLCLQLSRRDSILSTFFLI